MAVKKGGKMGGVKAQSILSRLSKKDTFYLERLQKKEKN